MRSYTFQTPEAARGFLNDLLRSAIGTPADSGLQAASSIIPYSGTGGSHIAGGPVQRGAMMPLSVGGLHDIATNHGGTSRTVMSTDRKENLFYRYPHTIRSRDRIYLHERDGTTKMLLEEPASDTFLLPPRTFNDTLDDYLEEQWLMHGFQRSAIAADILQARDGAAFVYAVGSNPSHDPLERGEPIIGYDHISRLDLKQEMPYTEASFLPYGFEHLIMQVRRPDGTTEEQQVHWTRVCPFVEDFLPRVPFGRSKVDAMFNDLWNLTDIVSASTKNSEQGNPIVFDVDIENSFHVDPTDTKKIEALRRGAEDFFSGATEYVGPNIGIKMRRLGKNELEDPTPNARIIASKLASASGTHNSNQILAQSRGSDQVTDRDILEYSHRIHKRRLTHGLRVLRWLVGIGNFTGALPKKARLPLHSLRWPDLRTLNQREEIFVIKSAAQALVWLDATGRDAPAWLDNMFPVNPEKVENLRTMPSPVPGTENTQPPPAPAPQPGQPAPNQTAQQRAQVRVGGITPQAARELVLATVTGPNPAILADPDDPEE